MAQTVEEIKAEILAAKAADSNLDGLTSTSKVAIWRLWINIFAMAIRRMQELWDVKKNELEVLTAAAVAGTALWYAERVKDWQYGHNVTVVDGKATYSIIDEAAQLAAYVAVVDGLPLKIKVAKDDSGDLVPLSTAEKTSLDSYIKDIKFAGTPHLTISTDADLVKTVATVYYDGELILADVKTAVETALQDHLKAIYFDGKFNKNRYRDAAEALTGIVLDIDITSIEIKPDGGSFVTVTREYTAESGYYKHDPANPLSSTLTYVAQ